MIKDSDTSTFRYRYLVASLQFFAFFLINLYRIGTGIGMVAMINNTAINSYQVFNSSIISCPLNYSDVMADALVENDGEFDWSPSIQGYILGSSFLGFLITLIPGGLLAETYGAKITILSGLLLSTVTHLLSPLAAWSSSYLMIALQLMRGLGQGLIPAAQSVLSTNWFPKSERGFLNSLIFLGYAFGNLICGFSSGAMCSSSLFGGWPSVYYIYGVFGLMFCLCFYILVFESPLNHPRISDTELNFILNDQESDLPLKRPPTPWKSILTSGEVYAVTYAIFGISWMGVHFQTVLPIFLGTILHFSIQENGIFTSSPFIFQLTLVFVANWISKQLNTHNYVGVDKVRKGSNILSCLGYSLCILGVYYAGCHRMLSACLSIAAVSFTGLAFTGCMITPFDMSPTFAGTLMGYSTTIGSLACFIFPVLVGILTNEMQTLEEWNKIFFISIGVVLSSGLVFCVFGSAEVQPWNYPSSEHLKKTSPNGNNCKYADNNCKEQTHDMELRADVVIHL